MDDLIFHRAHKICRVKTSPLLSKPSAEHVFQIAIASSSSETGDEMFGVPAPQKRLRDWVLCVCSILCTHTNTLSKICFKANDVTSASNVM